MKKPFILIVAIIFSIEVYSQTAEEFKEQGMEYLNDANYSSAIEYFTKVIEIDPRDPQAYMLRGAAKGQMKDCNGEIADITKAIEMQTNNPEMYNRRADAKSYCLKDYTGAIEDYTKAFVITRAVTLKACNMTEDDSLANYVVDSKNTNALNGRAKAKCLLNDYQGAIADFTLSIAISPKNFTTYMKRAEVKQQLQDFSGAIDDLTKAIEFSSKYPMGYFQRGLVKIDSKDYVGAIADFDQALIRAPRYAEAFYQRGIAKIQSLPKESGCEDFYEARKLGYEEAFELIKKHCL